MRELLLAAEPSSMFVEGAQASKGASERVGTGRGRQEARLRRSDRETINEFIKHHQQPNVQTRTLATILPRECRKATTPRALQDVVGLRFKLHGNDSLKRAQVQGDDSRRPCTTHKDSTPCTGQGDNRWSGIGEEAVNPEPPVVPQSPSAVILKLYRRESDDMSTVKR